MDKQFLSLFKIQSLLFLNESCPWFNNEFEFSLRIAYWSFPVRPALEMDVSYLLCSFGLFHLHLNLSSRRKRWWMLALACHTVLWKMQRFIIFNRKILYTIRMLTLSDLVAQRDNQTNTFLHNKWPKTLGCLLLRALSGNHMTNGLKKWRLNSGTVNIALTGALFIAQPYNCFFKWMDIDVDVQLFKLVYDRLKCADFFDHSELLCYNSTIRLN